MSIGPASSLSFNYAEDAYKFSEELLEAIQLAENAIDHPALNWLKQLAAALETYAILRSGDPDCLDGSIPQVLDNRQALEQFLKAHQPYLSLLEFYKKPENIHPHTQCALFKIIEAGKQALAFISQVFNQTSDCSLTSDKTRFNHSPKTTRKITPLTQ